MIINDEKNIDLLNERITRLENNPKMPDHLHNGFDSSFVNYDDIDKKKVFIHHTLIGTTPATAAYYGVFYIVPFTCILTKFKEVHQVAGSVNGTLMLEKLTGTEAADSGDDMLASTLSLTATANTVQTGVLSATNANLNLAIGDRLCLKDAGTLTTTAGLSIIVELLLT